MRLQLYAGVLESEAPAGRFRGGAPTILPCLGLADHGFPALDPAGGVLAGAGTLIPVSTMPGQLPCSAYDTQFLSGRSFW